MASDVSALPWDRNGSELWAVVETPRGSRYKYAFDPTMKALRVSFMLARGLSWPYDYGFIPQTLADDGDPADVIVMMEEPLDPLSVVRARLIGGFEMTKDGVRNDRLLACPTPMRGIAMLTDGFSSIDDLPSAELAQLERFLCEYSEEQGHDITLARRYGPDEARSLAKQWHKAWRQAR
jgi:inorganic pyrophosphatase